MYNANILKRKEAAAAKPLRPSDRLFRGRGRSALPLPLLPLLLPLLLLLADVTAASAAVLLRRYCRAHYIYSILYYLLPIFIRVYRGLHQDTPTDRTSSILRAVVRRRRHLADLMNFCLLYSGPGGYSHYMH